MSETPKSKSPIAIALPERRIIAVSGKDATHFLHNVLTANIERVAPGAGTLAALLTPQGKIIADMLVFNASDPDSSDPSETTWIIDCGRGFADDLIERLGKYRLRAEAIITPLEDEIGVTVVLDAAPVTGDLFYTFADPRHAGLGQRLIGPKEAIAEATAALPRGEADAYFAARIALGIPEMGRDYMSNDAFPHEVLLDQLAGVDFKKGCYIGQEVVSRMEHRGTARTRALPVRFRNGFGVLGGSEIMAGDRPLGRLGESIGDSAIALIRLDRLEEAFRAGQEITGGGVALDVIVPDFVRFPVPQRTP